MLLTETCVLWEPRFLQYLNLVEGLICRRGDRTESLVYRHRLPRLMFSGDTTKFSYSFPFVEKDTGISTMNSQFSVAKRTLNRSHSILRKSRNVSIFSVICDTSPYVLYFSGLETKTLECTVDFTDVVVDVSPC